MSKFYKLENYLKETHEDLFTLSFDEIEDILGFMLSDSAYDYPAYWVPSDTHTLPNLIRDCGFKIDVDMHRLKVTFRRYSSSIINNHNTFIKTEKKAIIKASKAKKDLMVPISTYVDKFTHIYHLDHNGRYMSYDHIRECFINYRKDESKRDLITLHLYAYLASWGMLRNSPLMQKDYLFSRPVVDILCSDKYEKLIDFNPFEEVSNEIINLIMQLAYDIKFYYIGKPYYGEGEIGRQEISNITDTLVSKILLGTFGCIVAYDRYVKLGLSSMKLNQKISKQSIMELCNFAKANEKEIKKILSNLNNLYTPMKVIDMYFFEKGFEMSK